MKWGLCLLVIRVTLCDDVSCAPFVIEGSPDFQTCYFDACGGQTISASLCYANSKCEGDTYLTLHNENNTRVALNDDYCGVCSALAYTVPTARSGCSRYSLRQGCFSAYCSGRTAVSVTHREAKVWNPWFYQDPWDHRGAIVTGWFVEVAFWGVMSIAQWISHRNNYPSAVRKIGVFKALVTFTLWFLLDFSILCSRFNFFLHNDNGSEYEPYRLRSGELVFLASEFFRATPGELRRAGCDYDGIVGAHEHSGDYACSFIYPLGLQLISQGYVQFSIGTQLVIIIFLQFTCLFTKILLIDQHSSDTATSTALACLLCATIEFILNCHQYMIMFPLTAVVPNPYCAVVQVPVSTEKAICLFKVAAATLPYGVPSVLGGCVILYLAYSFGRSGSKTNNAFMYILSFLVGVAGLYFFVTGLCLVFFWLFGCIVLGMWYGVEGVARSYAAADTALILNLMKSSVFLFSFFDVVLFPLPLKDENSFYHASWMKINQARSYIYDAYASEPCCVDMCNWLWVHASTFELWLSDKVGTCWDTMMFCCFDRRRAAQVACEDIMITDK